eukprot:gene3118-2100_t
MIIGYSVWVLTLLELCVVVYMVCILLWFVILHVFKFECGIVVNSRGDCCL